MITCTKLIFEKSPQICKSTDSFCSWNFSFQKTFQIWPFFAKNVKLVQMSFLMGYVSKNLSINTSFLCKLRIFLRSLGVCKKHLLFRICNRPFKVFIANFWSPKGNTNIMFPNHQKIFLFLTEYHYVPTICLGRAFFFQM